MKPKVNVFNELLKVCVDEKALSIFKIVAMQQKTFTTPFTMFEIVILNS
jgi:hypothetical protein